MYKKTILLFFVLFSILFYGYHVREFGMDSMVSTMSLASCISLFCFVFAFTAVGKDRY